MLSEFNIPAGDSGYEILYFGVNLILMFDYRLSFDIQVKNSNEKIGILIISRKEIPAWKANDNIKNMKIYLSINLARESMTFLNHQPVMRMHLF
jgi:hypothetical protein